MPPAKGTKISCSSENSSESRSTEHRTSTDHILTPKVGPLPANGEMALHNIVSDETAEAIIRPDIHICESKSGDRKTCEARQNKSNLFSKDSYEPIRKLAMVKLQPPRNPSKPFTSFSIADILSDKRKPTRPIPLDPRHFLTRAWDSHVVSPELRRSYSVADSDEEDIVVDDDPPPRVSPVSPLDALFKMANKTFEGLDDCGLTGRTKDREAIQKGTVIKKRRKSRTAFSNQQIYELEKRFLYQKYLTPADRDDIAQSLGLSNAQVITWFQNRRAKLKRDLEELKADVTAARVIGGENVSSIMLEKGVEVGLTKIGGVL